MVHDNQDKRKLNEFMKTAYMLGHVAAEVFNDMNKWSDWWISLSDERREAIHYECTAYLVEGDKGLKKVKGLRDEQITRKWLIVIFPIILTIHSISYVPKWWYSVLIFIGAALAARLLLLVWDFLKGRFKP